MDPYIKDLTYVIKNTRMTNTYKMVWIRSIVEICKFNRELKNIHFDEISEIIFEKYWDQTIFFDLEQGSNTKEPPKIYQIVSEKIENYRENFGYQPKFYSEVRDKVNVPLEEISYQLTRYVSHLFQEVNKINYKIYDLDLKNRIVRPYRPDLIHDHFELLTDVISYRWVQFLEGFNESPKISRKVRGTDQKNIKRDTKLKNFWEFLDLENPNRICFHSGKPIEQGRLEVDHVVPWSYLFSDDIWNLVFVDKSVNSSKSNSIPTEDTIHKLENRNERLLELMKSHFPINKHTRELDLSIKLGLVRKRWIGCQ